MWGSNQAWERQANRVEDWLPESFEETKQLHWFTEQFGSDELLMVSWDGCTLEDERLSAFADRLLEPVEHDGRQTHLFRQVWTGPEIFESFTTEPIDLDYKSARRRLRRWLIGSDDKTTCAIALVTKEGKKNRRAAIEHVWRSADATSDLGRDQLHMAGSTYDGVAIDIASKSSLMVFNVFSFVICFVWMVIFLRNFKLAGCVFLTAFFSEMGSMALMHYSGQQLDSVLLLVANLTFVLGVAGGVHLVNYYRDACLNGHENPVNFAVKTARRPTLLAAATTALGMVSLCISEITPVRNFGGFAAISVLAGSVVLLVVLPAMIAFWPPKRPRIKDPRASDGLLWRGLAGVLGRCHWAVLVLALATLAGQTMGMSKLRTSTRLDDLLSPSARVIQDYRWLEENVGNLVPIEIVLRFPQVPNSSTPTDEDNSPAIRQANAERFVDRMRYVETVRMSAASTEGVGASVSASTFVVPLPKKKKGKVSIGARARRKIVIRRIYSGREQLQESGYFLQQEDEQLWRISLRVTSSRDVDYGDLLAELNANVLPMLGDAPGGQVPEIIICGGVPLVYKAQDQLLKDLISSFALALAMIATVMMVLLRNVVTGLLAMVPNVLPCVIVFGTMGWLGFEVEIGSMLTASVALGIAVDNTLHYITWFQKGRSQGFTPVASLAYAYRHCGAAMLQTSVICSLGLVVFALSPFMPIARFAWVMFTLLLLAVVCDLVILPAILLLCSRRKSPVAAQPPTAEVTV